MWITLNWLTVCSSGFYEQGAKPSGSTQSQHYINQLDYHELPKKDLAPVCLYKFHISGDFGGPYVWGDLESENYREQNSHPTIRSVHVLHATLYKMFLLSDNCILRDSYPTVVLSKVTNLFSDMSYVAVCEANRHVYIYRQPVALATELRNRRTGQYVARTAKQQLVNLDSMSEVLGVHASCNMLYVLTVDTLYALRVSYGSSAES